ncbi:hypothetical protein DPMN_176439 [Dreissena polymorpha]|uniref:Uncharacterized protein n=1 Tax=Dreissena polymorpha TaxID=45954 RepID=A0A9D4E8D6_DREPO|nr:hypothetical protein DPMN_176439 [Dreissena polymorpha]
MSKTKTTGKSESKKRDASSPLNQADMKKVRTFSLESIPDEDHLNMSDQPSHQNIINLSNEDITRISDILKQPFDLQISNIVSSIASGVLGGLNTEIAVIKSENLTLRNQVNQLESKVADMNALIDRQNQYSHRNCLRLSGVSETQGENTDTTVTKILSAIGANISIDEIDRSHRLGKPRKSPSSIQKSPST